MDSGNMIHRLVINYSGEVKTIDLQESIYSLGRSGGNSIVIPSQKISRMHATIVKRPGDKPNQHYFYIFDGDLKGNHSSNGVFVNGNKITEHQLKNGDEIIFADDIKASYVIVYPTLDELLSEEQNSTDSDEQQEHKITQI